MKTNQFSGRRRLYAENKLSVFSEGERNWLEFLYFGVTLFRPIRRGFSCAAPTCLYKSSDRTGCASNWHSRLLGIVPVNLENREEHFTVSADLKANYFFLAFSPSRVKDHQLVLRTKAKENQLHISFIWLRTLKSSLGELRSSGLLLQRETTHNLPLFRA